MAKKHELFDGSKYHTGVVFVYLAIFSYFLLSLSLPAFNWSFNDGDLELLIHFTILSLISLCVATLMLGAGKVKFKRYSAEKFALLVFYALIFSVFEEVLFRGIVQGVFLTTSASTTFAVIMSSLIYALAHILNGATAYLPRGWNWKLVVLTFIAGLYLGSVYAITESLALPIILHALFIITNQIFIKRS